MEFCLGNYLSHRKLPTESDVSRWMIGGVSCYSSPGQAQAAKGGGQRRHTFCGKGVFCYVRSVNDPLRGHCTIQFLVLV